MMFSTFIMCTVVNMWKMKVLAAAFVLCSLVSYISANKYCRPSQSCWPDAAAITEFKLRMNATQARVMTKDDADWVSKYLTYNQAVAEVPGMVVFVGTAEHIRESLKFAYKYDIEVRIQSSGHSFFGRCGGTGVMQISVHYMKGIDIDMNCKENAMGCMNAQAGVQFSEAYKEAAKYKRVIVGGSDPSVSVSGWNMGGGHSPLSRSFGLGVDNALSFHLITADLSEVWSSASGTNITHLNGTTMHTSDTELFWALRGGGSAYGVLIDVTFKMYQDDVISQIFCSYPAYQDGFNKTFEVVLKSLTDLMLRAPNTFSGYLLPTVGCSIEGCRGTMALSLLHFGNRSSDDEWVQKFTSLPAKWTKQGLTSGGCSMKEFGSFYEYEKTVPSNTYTTVYLGNSLIQHSQYSNGTVDAMLNQLYKVFSKTSSEKRANIVGTATWIGGAVKNGTSAAVSRGFRNALFSFSYGFFWDPEATPDPSSFKADIRSMSTAMSPYSDGKYYNEAEDDMKPDEWKKQFWGDDMYAKLLAIKKRWDPQNRFTCRQCVGSDWDPAAEKLMDVKLRSFKRSLYRLVRLLVKAFMGSQYED